MPPKLRVRARAACSRDRGLRRHRVHRSLLASFAENDVLQDECIVVGLVPGLVDEGDRTLAGAAAEILQHLWLMGELRPVAAAKLVPALGVMPEPRAEPGARRDLLEPFVEPGFRLADSARPQAVDQNSCARGFVRRV